MQRRMPVPAAFQRQGQLSRMGRGGHEGTLAGIEGLALQAVRIRQQAAAGAKEGKASPAAAARGSRRTPGMGAGREGRSESSRMSMSVRLPHWASWARAAWRSSEEAVRHRPSSETSAKAEPVQLEAGPRRRPGQDRSRPPERGRTGRPRSRRRPRRCLRLPAYGPGMRQGSSAAGPLCPENSWLARRALAGGTLPRPPDAGGAHLLPGRPGRRQAPFPRRRKTSRASGRSVRSRVRSSASVAAGRSVRSASCAGREARTAGGQGIKDQAAPRAVGFGQPGDGGGHAVMGDARRQTGRHAWRSSRVGCREYAASCRALARLERAGRLERFVVEKANAKRRPTRACAKKKRLSVERQAAWLETQRAPNGGCSIEPGAGCGGGSPCVKAPAQAGTKTEQGRPCGFRALTRYSRKRRVSPTSSLVGRPCAGVRW